MNPAYSCFDRAGSISEVRIEYVLCRVKGQRKSRDQVNVMLADYLVKS